MRYYLFTRNKIATEHDTSPLWDMYEACPDGTELFQFSDRVYHLSDWNVEEGITYEDAWKDVDLFRIFTHLEPAELVASIRIELEAFDYWALISAQGVVWESFPGGPATQAFNRAWHIKGAGFGMLFVKYDEENNDWEGHAAKLQAALGAKVQPFFYARNGRAFIIGDGRSFEELKIPLNRHQRRTFGYAGVDGMGNAFLNGKWCNNIWYMANAFGYVDEDDDPTEALD
ncbi:hypothetical protein [Asticcacaulis sp.]|uniref:hypothetical protein n=1 Tax=Asticcacaulis sp. TaxID=1872648 RepID=UPI002CC9E72D|nr:hypothetical protein [Asticcacaulis sp.]HTM79785.1 hypothetical protein [Asticcacaulis sp.]